MRGLQLDQARQLRRRELRRSPGLVGITIDHCLAIDVEELVRRADLGDVSAQGNIVKRRLVLDAVSTIPGAEAAIIELWHVDRATLAGWRSIPLLDKSGAAAKIDAQVLAELPETPEPGREQQPPASYDARNDRRWAPVD
jgi:hypothetical protein